MEDDANWIRAHIEISAKTGNNIDLLLELLLAIGASKEKGTVDKKFPTYQQDEDTGAYPVVEDLLNKSEHHLHMTTSDGEVPATLIRGRSWQGQAELLKVTLVGDNAIGKTCLINTLLHSKGELLNEAGEPLRFSVEEHEYEATTFDTKTLPGLQQEDQIYDIEFYDTSGREEMKELRRLSYCDAHVYVLGYAVNKPTSLENVSMQWIPEITTTDPDAVIVLVGFHADMRESQENCVSTEEAHVVADEASMEDDANWIRAHIEISAKTGENCDLLMDLLVAIAAANKKGDVDKKFPTYQKNEETGLYPHAEHVLRRSNSMSNSTGGSTFI